MSANPTVTTKDTQRVLPISGSHNFRDMGGYAAADGQHVRWHMLYRSGSMAQIDPAEHARLHELGIVSICDFRTNGERERAPPIWHDGQPVELVTQDYTHLGGVLSAMLQDAAADRARVSDAMHQTYARFPIEQAENYRKLFARLTAGQVPLVFNCSAGKDRTGLAAALVLGALGVSQEDILADYMLTNASIEGLAAILAQAPDYGVWVTERRDTIEPLLRAEADYLETSFDVITREYGDLYAYLDRALGVREADVERMRGLLLA